MKHIRILNWLFIKAAAMGLEVAIVSHTLEWQTFFFVFFSPATGSGVCLTTLLAFPHTIKAAVVTLPVQSPGLSHLAWLSQTCGWTVVCGPLITKG